MLHSFFIAPPAKLLYVAHLGLAMIYFALRASALLLKVFALVEACFFAVLIALVAFMRLGRSGVKERTPILATTATRSKKPMFAR